MFVLESLLNPSTSRNLVGTVESFGVCYRFHAANDAAYDSEEHAGDETPADYEAEDREREDYDVRQSALAKHHDN